MIRFTRARLALLALLMAPVIAGCGAETSDDARDSSADSSVKPELAAEEERQVDVCRDLIKEGWTAPETEPSITYDAETGVAEVSFTEEQDDLAVDLLNDPDCKDLPDIGPLLSRTRANHDEAMQQVCEDAKKSLAEGHVPEGEDMTLEQLRTYVTESCSQ